MGYTSGLMAENMKGNGNMGSSMEKENIFCLMEASNPAFGNKGKEYEWEKIFLEAELITLFLKTQ
jgi:hypothetical protein